AEETKMERSMDLADEHATTEPIDLLDDESRERPPPRESARSGTRAVPALGARIEAALAASARTEAALADVLRTVKFLSATVSAVRDAKVALARELESLAGLMNGGADERTTLAGRIQRLERVLEEAGEDAVRERDRLLSEHDKFITMLLAD